MTVMAGESRKVKIAHSFNFLKFRILECLVLNHPRAMTTKEIAEQLKEKPHNVAKSISLAHVRGYGYYRRHKRKKGEPGYRYTITRLGILRYRSYLVRIKCGLSLNMRKTDHMAHYKGISPRDINLKTREARRVTREEFLAYLKIKEPEDLSLPDNLL